MRPLRFPEGGQKGGDLPGDGDRWVTVSGGPCHDVVLQPVGLRVGGPRRVHQTLPVAEGDLFEDKMLVDILQGISVRERQHCEIPAV